LIFIDLGLDQNKQRKIMKNTVYNRKISSKEAHEGFIFILKNKLNFFPPLKIEFTLINNNSPANVKVESFPCTCQGPETPHEHYFIPWEGLRKGDMIEIVKEGKNYKLQINP
jgi:hypothetical protein